MKLMDEKVTQLVNKYIGRKFVHGEFDCYHFLIEWFKEFGYEVPSYTYDKFWYRNGRNFFLEEYHKLWRKVEEDEEVKLNDVVLMKVLAPVPNHVGICLGDGRFIHCSENLHTLISHLDKYKKMIHGHYRLRASECLQK